MTAWRQLSLDAKVVGALAFGNWLLLFGDHTVVQVTRDAPVWRLFPGLWAPAWMLLAGLLAIAYPLRDHRLGAAFTARGRALHLAAIVTWFVIVPAIAMIVLRETGKPYTYVHDGAIMVEEAARKLLAGQDPYVADYLDTPLFYWPMLNNPALYHFTYFPLFFLVTAPFVAVFDRLGVFFDVRYLYLPAFVATLVLLPLLLTADRRGEGAAARGRVRSRGAASLARERGSPVAEDDPPDEGPRRATERREARPEATSPGLAPLEAQDGYNSPPGASYMLALVAIVALDPQLFPFVAEGRNDFFVLLPLFAGIALLQRERRTLGVLALAVAAALKLNASLLLPFATAYLWWSDAATPRRERMRRLARAVVPGAVVLAATFVPFLVHDLGAFWDDVVSYNSGGAAWSYPISGLGFSAVLLATGVVTYPQEGFPFWAFELLAAAPIAVWALVRLRRAPRIDTLLLGYALTLLAFGYFGRYFNGNHLGFIVAVAAPVPFLRAAETAGLADRAATRLRALAALPAVSVAGEHTAPSDAP